MDTETLKGTVLIVDDSRSTIDVLKTVLEDEGYEIMVATSGEKAIKMAGLKTPDLILLDVIMPGMDGFETCRSLKADKKSSDIPVIFMTGLTDSANKIRGFKEGGIDYLTKPIEVGEVLARLKTHLTLRNMHRLLEAQNELLQQKIEEHQHAEEEIRILNLELEQRVEKRTAELRQANEQLKQEIEERKRGEEALRESEERYRTVIEACNDGVAIIEGDLPIFVNQRYVEIHGYERREEVLGKPISHLLHPDGRERVTRFTLLRQEGTPAPPRYEFKALRKDGKEVHVEVSATRTIYRGRAVSLTFHRDITQRKQLEVQLQQAQKMEAMGTLAGGIAHDFNNILAVIVGCTELLLLTPGKDPQSKSHLKQIHEATNRATDLVQQILTFSRQRALEKVPLQLSLIVKEVLKMLRASLPSTIRINQYIDPDSGLTFADPTQVHQVLMNLCTNAAHAMCEQGGVLEVSLSNLDIPPGDGDSYPDISPGAYLRLTVSDTGHGMKREVLERIFDPYFTTKAIGEGTGLGLAVVHGIIQNYQGVIRVHSEPEQGTTFQILLPRLDYASVLEDSGLRPEDLPLGHERILFVDDEESIIKTSQSMLKYLGYEVVATTNSIDALRRFREQPDRFDLVLTDMTMPHLTGDMLAREIMKIRPGIPVILCTGFSERITEAKAKALGIRALVLKPLAMQDLAIKVREALDLKEVK